MLAVQQMCGEGIDGKHVAVGVVEDNHRGLDSRLQLHQQQAAQNLPLSNRLDPDSLNHLDRRILRESFRQAQRLQSSLALRYQL